MLVSRPFEDLPLCFTSVLESEKALLKELDPCHKFVSSVDPGCAAH